MKNSLVILGWFGAGILVGRLSMLPEIPALSNAALYVVYLLVLLVGVGIGGDAKSWQALKATNIKIVLVPLSVIVGTLAGVGLVSFLLPTIGLRESLAVGAGFGYYSLSSVLISQARGETLGVVALLSNLIREIATLLLAPPLVSLFGKLAPIACGGATAMDSTLPVIIKSAGKEYAVVSLISGLVISIAVPILITLILTA